MAKKLSASQAAKRVGVSTPTISRAIKSGKISAEPNPKGGWFIDPSELKRVYGDTPVTSNAKPHTSQTELHTENRVLQVQLEAKSEKIADLERQLAKAEAATDEWKSQAQTLAIANQNRPQGQGAKIGRLGHLAKVFTG